MSSSDGEVRNSLAGRSPQVAGWRATRQGIDQAQRRRQRGLERWSVLIKLHSTVRPRLERD